MSSPHSSGNPTLARTGSGKAPLRGEDPHGEEEQPQVDEVMSQLEQLVDLLEQYFHPSNNGRSVGKKHSFLRLLHAHALTDTTTTTLLTSGFPSYSHEQTPILKLQNGSKQADLLSTIPANPVHL